MKLKNNRRAFLKGAAGITIGLPLADFAFDAFNSGKLYAQDNAGTTPRLVTMYFPNGAMNQVWNYEQALKPIADMKDKIILLQGLTNPTVRGAVDGHESGAASLFTGMPLLNDQKGTGISMDQWLSRRIDMNTALKRPLVMGVWRGWAGGLDRSPTWYRRSWLENGDPVTPYIKPLEVFKILFGDSSSIEEKKFKLERQKSVLDSIVEQYKSQTSDNSKLPASHKDMLKTHLERIRDLEKRVAQTQNEAFQCQVPKTAPGEARIDGKGLPQYSDFEVLYRQQMDLMVLALQCGLTNTGSLMFCCAGEEYVNAAVSSTHTDHGTSHWSTQETYDIYLKYRQYHATNFRYMLDKLKAANLLDSTTLLYGSEFENGQNHNRDPQPILVAGGGSNLKMGQIIDGSAKHHTSNDVWATVLTALGHKVEKFGQQDCNNGHITEMFKS